MNKIFLMKINEKFIKIPESLGQLLDPQAHITFDDLKKIAFSYETEQNLFRNYQNQSNFLQIKAEFFQFREEYLRYEDEFIKAANIRINLMVKFFEELIGNFDESRFKQLFELGANVNYKDAYGETLLYKNVFKHLKFWHLDDDFPYLENCKVLLAYGADPDIQDQWSRNVHQIIANSKSKGKIALENILREYRTEPSSSVTSSSMPGTSQNLNAAELEEIKKEKD